MLSSTTSTRIAGTLRRTKTKSFFNTIRSEIPAVTHVDMLARIQTVHKETNPRYDALLSAFKVRTGCPVLVNTSFNVRSEPIVCTRRTRSAALWEPISNFWLQAIASPARKTKILHCASTIRIRSSLIDNCT